MLKEKFIGIWAFLKKEENSQITNLNFYLKEIKKKKEKKKKKSKKKKIKKEKKEIKKKKIQKKIEKN